MSTVIHRPLSSHIVLAALLALPAVACSSSDPPADGGAGGRRGYTEMREPCAERDPLRKAFFGDLHVHTSLSFDAWTYDVRTLPADAYKFARGETIKLAPLDADGKPTRPVKLARPLDFAAVTDHSEYLGETSLCTTPGSPAYDTSTCKQYRPGSFFGLGVGADPPSRADICGPDGKPCTDAALPVWKGIQEAAEAAYDRTSACSFTSFVAYEYTLSPFGSNMHRNVIFRNATALPAPITYYDAPRAIDLWTALRNTCNDAGNGCDALAIPHNSNVSNGRLFHVEYWGKKGVEDEKRQARLRAEMEPLVEIYQHKGDSECINGLSTFAGAPDELCDAEKMQKQPLLDCGPTGTGTGALAGIGCTSWLDYVRNVWKAGLMEQARIGVDPYKLGVIASTDTHNGTPGRVDESTFEGHLGNADRDPAVALGTKAVAAPPLRSNPGGLAGVWAEENSRDAIFDALRRRETFGTSGPRITVRLFAGWDYPGDLCDDPEMVKKGYAGGVPMGGDLPPHAASSGAPRFVVSALRDPGTAESPGTKLQRVEVIKIWLDAKGEPQEKVIVVAGSADNGASVDEKTCAPKGDGADLFCTVWSDPDFDPALPAAYYLRAVENPTCRWSTWVCNGLTPEKQAELACDALGVPKTIQERAWSSPVWYTP
ncbi:MAG: DUF3604 domain-containing protein [Byssovorax sp.]